MFDFLALPSPPTYANYTSCELFLKANKDYLMNCIDTGLRVTGVAITIFVLIDTLCVISRPEFANPRDRNFFIRHQFRALAGIQFIAAGTVLLGYLLNWAPDAYYTRCVKGVQDFGTYSAFVKSLPPFAPYSSYENANWLLP